MNCIRIRAAGQRCFVIKCGTGLLTILKPEKPLGMEHRQDKRMFCIELGDQAVLRSVVVGRDASMRCAFIDGRWVLVEAAHRFFLSG